MAVLDFNSNHISELGEVTEEKVYDANNCDTHSWQGRTPSEKRYLQT